MRRIVIIGCSGAGKSTLARRIGERLRLPVVHLDALFWEPGWVEPETAAFRGRVAEAHTGDRWVSEGLYLSKTFDLRLPRAELIVWLHQPRWLCIVRVVWRALTYRRGKGARPDLAPGCHEQFDSGFLPLLAYIWTFEREKRPRTEAAIEQLAPGTRVVHLRGDREAAAFLGGLER
jgi:adenylate kinase family enzyme